ncbi:MAG: hypothetical protein OXG07_00240 [Anaerolineaceae bacterium]|nr:hypothetical protein [Anaerolineaceae bacterium]MCY3907369.1 hypothetical protein [Anaerolineaceae bacterium]MDD9957082.1 hypothetical protein [Anaerolineaceae bacterium]MDE0329002.1 hypothetical protein [Anaerolineaceae bacterium]
MSRRRTRRPNLPQDTLARARREAGLEEAPAAAPQARRRSEGERGAGRSARRARSLRAGEELTQEEIAERLANPVRQVSEGQLRAQYGYVIADLRSMGLLALGLFVLMIAAALVL